MLQPRETDLVGKWEIVAGKVVGDATERRIQALITTDLRRVAATSGGWDVLYVDPRDGRLWELTWPSGELHGGGPRHLTNLPYEEARRKYGAGVNHQR